MAWLPPKVLPPVVHPTNVNQVDIYEPYFVPHVHPTHTQYNYHKIYNHENFCPHTESVCCDEHHQVINHCRPPFC